MLGRSGGNDTGAAKIRGNSEGQCYDETKEED